MQKLLSQFHIKENNASGGWEKSLFSSEIFRGRQCVFVYTRGCAIGSYQQHYNKIENFSLRKRFI